MSSTENLAMHSPGDWNDESNGVTYVFLVAFVAAVGGFLFGYDLNVVAGAATYLRDHFDLTSEQFGLAMSSAILGALTGPLISGAICDRVGRRRALLGAAILFGVSAIGTALPRSIFEFNVYRFIGGVGVGIASVVSPMYIAEISPPRLRGRLVMMNQLAIVVGALIAICAAWIISTALPEQVSWRWMFGSEIVPIVLFAIFLIMVPESPRWLLERGRGTEALEVLTRINGRSSAREQYGEIVATLATEPGKFGDLFHPGMRKALVLGIVLSVLSQWTGWSMISFYLTTIFEKAGVSQKSDAILWAIAPNVANIGFSVLGLLLVDRVGRRPLYLVGAILMVVSTAFLGWCFQQDVQGPLVLVAVTLCALPHAVALGSVPWLIVSEIFPNGVRSWAMSLCALTLWIAAFISTHAAPQLFFFFEERFGTPAGLFFLSSGFSIAAFVFAWWNLPETRGRSLEDIANAWTQSPPARGNAVSLVRTAESEP